MGYGMWYIEETVYCEYGVVGIGLHPLISPLLYMARLWS
jgi:hypothetical protein